jgi:sugar-specific transcriptional regulator TrmB
MVKTKLYEEYEVQLLIQMGFTRSQATVYLSLLKLGDTDSKELSKEANLSSQQVFRIIRELQEIGLVERELIMKPYKFKAIPPELGLKLVLTQRLKQYREMQENVIESFKKAQWYFNKFAKPI